jgi:hypothetical protein
MTEWRTSSYTNNGTCVEVADLPGGGTAVRDSKDPASPVLTFTAAEWVAFVRGVKAGEFG